MVAIKALIKEYTDDYEGKVQELKALATSKFLDMFTNETME